jgi:hypothetical protein
MFVGQTDVENDYITTSLDNSLEDGLSAVFFT